MGDYKNTRPGYEPEAVETIPDEEDPGVGFSAGDRVRISEDHDTFPDEPGEVYLVGRGIGLRAGTIVVDVLIDGTDHPYRFSIDEIGETL